MTFDEILEGVNFDLLSDAEENTTDHFLRRVKRDKLTPRDFRSSWEKHGPLEPDSIKELASWKGVSIHTYEPDSFEDVIEHYLVSISHAPSGKGDSWVCRFTFTASAGLVKHTPVYDSTGVHNDFYKSDQFELGMVQVDSIRHIDEIRP